MASAISAAKITGNTNLITSSLVSSAQNTAAGAANSTIATAAAVKDTTDPFVTVSNFNSSQALTNAVAIVATNTAAINNTASNKVAAATTVAVTNLNNTANNANSSVGNAVTVVQAVSNATSAALASKVASIADTTTLMNSIPILANASTFSVPTINETTDSIQAVAPITTPVIVPTAAPAVVVTVNPANPSNLPVDLVSAISDVSATKVDSETSTAAVVATPTAPVAVQVTPSYNGESIKLGTGYNFEVCKGICNTTDSTAYDYTKKIGEQFIFRCHCPADFSSWFFMENGDRFTPCPENDLGKCHLHYFGASDSEIFEKDSEGHIANPNLSDIFGRIKTIEGKILAEEDARRSRSFLKPSAAERFMQDKFDHK